MFICFFFLFLFLFESFICHLDGSKSIPINHGATTKDKLLENAAKICGEYMARNPDEVRFTMIALAAASE